MTTNTTTSSSTIACTVAVPSTVAIAGTISIAVSGLGMRDSFTYWFLARNKGAYDPYILLV